MPSIFRSEKVEFCQLVIPSESAYSVIQTIGQLECVEFINRNFDVSPFNLKFTQNVVWCEEMERRLGNLHNVLQSDKLEADEVPHNYGTLLPQNFGNFESEINSISTDIESNNKNLKDLRDGYNELTFYRQVVRCADELDDNFNQNATESSNNISGVYGVVSRFQVNVFEKFLYRACRGNVLFRRLDPEHEFTDIVTAETSIHCIFVIYLQGDLLMNKVKKISQVFGVPTFSVPDTHHERETLLLTLMTRVKDMELILHQTLAQRKTFINRLVRNLNIWKVQIRRAKAIFVTLNMFHYDTGSHTLIAECWCPHADIEKVQNALVIPESNDLAAILNTMQTPRTPPTFFRTNKFTRGFQNLVDAYGVANYKEINPSLFMVITFPFLFSVMFGDFGHAAVIFIFAVYLVVQEKALEKYKHMEMFDMLYAGRYIIFMMGLFSLYAGFIYNDIISKSVYIFPSSWKLPDHRNISGPGSVYLDPVQITQPDPYPIGLDPVWMFASNKITFVNSLKMKLSVIIGFIHMTFGILCGAANNLYFGKYLDFFAEFVPQILFFVSLFGYLVFLIFYKWIFVSSHGICGAPSILLTFINMFFEIGKEIPECDRLYKYQEYVQMVLVTIALICVPWLFLAKPIALIIRKKRRPANPPRVSNEDVLLDMITPEDQVVHMADESEKGIGEIMIMQMIHTIEFCLGCLSNIASYLRLWALSLAHSQLSELLWIMVFQPVLRISSPYGFIFIVFVINIFLVLSFCILVVMEGLSTFLHALRLHWVEFQSKFYSGAGHPLRVFTFRHLMTDHLVT